MTAHCPCWPEREKDTEGVQGRDFSACVCQGQADLNGKEEVERGKQAVDGLWEGTWPENTFL